jgi:hypothetical protein
LDDPNEERPLPLLPSEEDEALGLLGRFLEEAADIKN